MRKFVVKLLLSIFIINLSSFTAQAFSSHRTKATTFGTSTKPLNQHFLFPSEIDLEATLSSTTNNVAVTTIDPTTALSQVVGGIIGSPIILLVPILVGASVAGVIAWYIVSYANPTDPDD